MVLVQGGGTLLAECKNTLWMIVEAEENASKSPSPLPTPDKEFETGGFSDSQGSGNVSPTIADMDLISKKCGDNREADRGYPGYESMESELCSACLPTADAVRCFRPLTITEGDQDMTESDENIVDSSEGLDEGAAGYSSQKGPLEDVDLLQGAEVFPPPMAPLDRCLSKGASESRDCKCKIVFKKCKGKFLFPYHTSFYEMLLVLDCMKTQAYLITFLLKMKCS